MYGTRKSDRKRLMGLPTSKAHEVPRLVCALSTHDTHTHTYIHTYIDIYIHITRIEEEYRREEGVNNHMCSKS